MKDKKREVNQAQEVIPDRLYFKIGEVSRITGVEPYVLRYWESEFDNVKPSRTRSKQRLYRRKDLERVLEIKRLLYNEKFTIAGAKKKLKKRGAIEAGKAQGNILSEERHKNLLKDIKNELKTIRNMIEEV